MTDAPELKPCPFCGTDGDISHDHTVEENHAFGCGKCHIWYDSFNSDDPIGQWNTRADLARPAPQPVGVKVKPLVWEQPRAYERTFYAKTPFGVWSVWEIGGDGYVCDPEARAGRKVEGGIEGAKLAAMGDVEEIVASALDLQPAASFEVNTSGLYGEYTPVSVSSSTQPAMLSREEADAMVAAAYLETSYLPENGHEDGKYFIDSRSARDIGDDIRDRTPADAQAALQRQLVAAKAEGRREALEIADRKIETMPVNLMLAEGIADGASIAVRACRDTIRALIEKEG